MNSFFMLLIIAITHTLYSFKEEDLQRLKTTSSCIECDLSDADLTGHVNHGANLTGSDLSGAKLAGAQLKGANLTKTNLQNANFSNAHLEDADLSYSTASGATFVNINGKKTSWRNANLDQANFYNAQLKNTDMQGAHLDSTHFGKANLHNVDLTNSTGHYIYDRHTNHCCTRLNDGTVRTESGPNCTREDREACQTKTQS